MSKLKDLTGKKFGRLKVLKRYGSNKKGQAMWMCECECGNINIVNGSNLRTGHVMSCGCLNKELAKERFIKHNLRHTKIYNVWRDMKYRCENKNNPQYKDYGGRGISVCDEWNDFNKFYNWAIENGYDEKLSIDRINNNEGYNPSNCRWANAKIQSNNKRNNLIVNINGEKYTVAQLSEKTGIGYEKLRSAYHKGNIMNIIHEVGL